MSKWVRPQWKRLAEVSGRKLHWWMARREALQKAGLLKLDGDHWMLDEAATFKWAERWRPSKPPGSRVVKPRNVPVIAEQIAAWIEDGDYGDDVLESTYPVDLKINAAALAAAIRAGRWRK